jgi:hypothetical protein
MPDRLRLLAEDADDLTVISTTLQDAVCKIGDIQFEPGARRLTLAMNRYRWEAGERMAERVRCGLQLGGVLGVQERRLRQDARKAVLELLAITFEPQEAPGGWVVFSFAGGGDLRARVECLDIALADVSEPWPASQRPSHSDV